MTASATHSAQRSGPRGTRIVLDGRRSGYAQVIWYERSDDGRRCPEVTRLLVTAPGLHRPAHLSLRHPVTLCSGSGQVDAVEAASTTR